MVDDVLGFLRRVGSGQGTGFGGRDGGEGGMWDCGRGGVVAAAAKAATHTSGRRVECAGVAVHSVTSRMYTVAVAVDGGAELDRTCAGTDLQAPKLLSISLPGGGTSVVRIHSRWRRFPVCGADGEK